MLGQFWNETINIAMSNPIGAWNAIDSSFALSNQTVHTVGLDTIQNVDFSMYGHAHTVQHHSHDAGSIWDNWTLQGRFTFRCRCCARLMLSGSHQGPLADAAYTDAARSMAQVMDVILTNAPSNTTVVFLAG